MEDSIEPLIKKFNIDLSRPNPVAVESVKSASLQYNLIDLPWTIHFKVACHAGGVGQSEVGHIGEASQGRG